MYEFALLAAVAGLACGLLVPVVKPLAIRLHAVDTPGGRRLHTGAVPRLGGIAIFAAFLITLAVAWFFQSALPAAADVNPHGALAFALGGTLVFALGVIDDLRSVRPAAKLAVQLVAALLVVIWGGCRIEGVSTPGGTVGIGVFSIPLTVLWIVVITNAVNLLDGLDGLAAGVVAIALLGVIAITHVEHASVAATAAIVIGACAGFLVHNFHPAKIFMGDSGSLFLGFALAVLSTYASAKAATGAVVLPVLIAALPLSDALWAIARRYLKGVLPISIRGQLAAFSRVFVPDRAHIHHRLLDAGLSQRQVVLVLYGIQIVLCLMTTYMATHMVAARAVVH